jgi:hypothetical protein
LAALAVGTLALAVGMVKGLSVTKAAPPRLTPNHCLTQRLFIRARCEQVRFSSGTWMARNSSAFMSCLPDKIMLS